MPNHERRRWLDRRRQAGVWSLFARTPRRRRSKGRRATDQGSYVDIYDARSWAWALSVLLLSLLDAVLTWHQIAGGWIEEANPFMKEILSRGGTSAFFSVKAGMTVFPLAIILVHKEWEISKFAVRICLWSYILVSIYHLFLLWETGQVGRLLHISA
jgi:hypothetical protein